MTLPKKETELIQEVGEWASKSFDVRDPALGIGEEIGEAIRCILKRKQKIRGYDDDEFFLEKFTDALADIMIYLCDWCHGHNAFFSITRNMNSVNPLKPEDEPKIIIHLLQCAAAIMSHDIFYSDKNEMANVLAQRMTNGVEMWAQLHKIDLRWAVSATWAENVSKRNWREHPDGPPSELTRSVTE